MSRKGLPDFFGDFGNRRRESKFLDELAVRTKQNHACGVVDRIIFVIKKGDMGAAIGRKGSNINRVKKSVGKQIEIVEYSDDVKEFLENLFQPAAIKNVMVVNKNNKRLAYVEVANKDKGIAIGRDGRNILKAKMLAQRHHGVDDIIIQ